MFYFKVSQFFFLPISFSEALLTVHDDYFIAFVCRFDNDVGVWVVGELLKRFLVV